MPPPNLIGVDLKLRRAEEHLRFLDAERGKILPIHPDRMVGQHDPQTGDYVVRVEGDPPPPEWGIPISEFAHALRTALDNLLWQLILARGGKPVSRVTQFPIYEEETKFNGKPKSRKGSWATEADRLTDGIFPISCASTTCR